MSTQEIILAFRNIAHTLGSVSVEGESNLDKMLGTIRYARNIADVLERAQKEPEKSEEGVE